MECCAAACRPARASGARGRPAGVQGDRRRQDTSEAVIRKRVSRGLASLRRKEGLTP